MTKSPYTFDETELLKANLFRTRFYKFAQCVPLLIASVVMLVLGVLSYIGLDTLTTLEKTQNKNLLALRHFTEVNVDLATFHVLTYDLLLSAQTAVDEGKFYDESKPLLLKMHTFDQRIQDFIGTYGEMLALQPLLIQLRQELRNYRQNTSNALLMATVDFKLAKKLLHESAKYYVLLNKDFLAINQLIDLQIKQKSSVYHQQFVDTVLFGFVFILSLIGVGIFVSRFISYTFHEKLRTLDTMLSVKQDDSMQHVSGFSILSLAIIKVAHNYKLLEDSKQQQLELVDKLNKEIENKKKVEVQLQEKTLTLKETVNKLKENNILIEEQAKTDALTGLPNRRFFVSYAEDKISQAKRSGEKLALMYIDLDGFKLINDKVSHLAGDMVLSKLGSMFSGFIRKNELIARLGGDEFCMVIYAYKNNDELENAANRLLRLCDKPMDVNGVKVKIGMSIGISIYPDHSEFLDKLVDKADKAMYVVKNKSKGGFAFYSD